MSLQPIEHTPPGLLDEGEIASITNAGLTVPVTIDTFIVFLTPNERTIPILPCLERRVRAGTYTWAVYMAEGDPDSLIGLKGDVWINATPYSRKIYVLGRRGTWGLWGWYNKGWPVTAPEYASDPKRAYKKAMRKKSLVTHASVPHPWLRGRRLEFDGVRLRWGVIGDRLQLHLQRLDEQLRAAGWPRYAKILPDWIAGYLCTAAPPSRGRVVVPPSAVKSELDEEYKPIPGPGWHGCATPSVPHTAVFGKDARVPAPSSHPVVKLEDAEDENTVRGLLICLRDMSSAPPGTPQSPEQCVVYEDQVAVASGSGHSMTASYNTPAVQRPSAYLSPHAVNGTGVNLYRFLIHLPRPLPYCEPVLDAIGITSIEHLHAFAAGPPGALKDLTEKLQEQGLPSADALAIRNGLIPIRTQAAIAAHENAPLCESQRRLRSVAEFLAALRPPLVHLAPLLEELGIAVSHLPTLAQMSPLLYVDFEQTLQARGVLWADCYLLRAGLKTHFPG